MGESEGTILKAAAQQNGPVPDRIKNAPELFTGLEFVLNCFYRLGSERAIGMGVGPIPWHAINALAQKYGMDEDDQSDLEFLIGKMDEAYLKHAAKKAEAKKEFDRSAAAQRKPLSQKLRERYDG